MLLDIESPSTFITNVSTLSRATNKLKTIKLKVVYKDGFIYLTRKNRDAYWYKNLLENNYAEIEVNNRILSANAFEMLNEDEKKEVSEIKYDDEKSMEQRYGFKLIIKEIRK
ncbi:MAG: hypothetical protein VX984_02065 [Thermodesulfobacteriota bacterium]|nr:hypothetical protein [Thermodesulfobacteriota bacterium]MEE2975405.1 hypothetical protein [Thermodesulfobacteriota bacterium]|tara:strand:+ start:49 stop:384 length:336 start_codon:yes stop_codon:yes gene_type:complete